MVDLNEDQIRFLDESLIPIRISVNTKSGFPTIVSLWYIFENGKFYCASIKTANLINLIKKNNKCAFEVSTENLPYKGIRGKGTIELDYLQGGFILKKLLTRYNIKKDSKLAKFLINRIEEEVALIITPMKIFTWDFKERMSDSR